MSVNTSTDRAAVCLFAAQCCCCQTAVNMVVEVTVLETDTPTIKNMHIDTGPIWAFSSVKHGDSNPSCLAH